MFAFVIFLYKSWLIYVILKYVYVYFHFIILIGHQYLITLYIILCKLFNLCGICSLKENSIFNILNIIIVSGKKIRNIIFIYTLWLYIHNINVF